MQRLYIIYLVQLHRELVSPVITYCQQMNPKPYSFVNLQNFVSLLTVAFEDYANVNRRCINAG